VNTETTLSIKPYRNSRLAQFVTRRVLELKSRKTQAQIAAEAGFRNPNMISMIKSGASKLALDRVPSLATALACDPARLFMMALEQIESPTTAAAIQRIFQTIITQNEADWINAIRDASGHTNPPLSGRARAAVRGIFGK
jgi:transcriptional regulator with XRE-family HTH domain